MEQLNILDMRKGAKLISKSYLTLLVISILFYVYLIVSYSIYRIDYIKYLFNRFYMIPFYISIPMFILRFIPLACFIMILIGLTKFYKNDPKKKAFTVLISTVLALEVLILFLETFKFIPDQLGALPMYFSYDMQHIDYYYIVIARWYRFYNYVLTICVKVTISILQIIFLMIIMSDVIEKYRLISLQNGRVDLIKVSKICQTLIIVSGILIIVYYGSYNVINILNNNRYLNLYTLPRFISDIVRFLFYTTKYIPVYIFILPIFYFVHYITYIVFLSKIKKVDFESDY